MRENTQKNDQQPTKRKVTPKQAAAILGVLLLILLYIVTLVVAIADRSSSGRLFFICLFCTIVIPLLIWIYTWMYGKLTKRHTFADFDLCGTDETSGESSKAPEA